MTLWVPKADAATIDGTASTGTNVASTLGSANQGFDSVQTSGWSGAANNAAVARAEALKGLLGKYTDRVSAGSTFLHDWAGQYGDYKQRLQSLDAEHTRAEQALTGIPGTAAKSGDAAADASAQKKLDNQRTSASAEVTRIENAHATLLAEYKAAAKNSAANIDSLCDTLAPSSPAALATWTSQQIQSAVSAAGTKAGQDAASKIKDDLKHSGKITPEELAILEQNKNDPDFVKGLYGSLGPQGIAAMSQVAKNGMDPRYQQDPATAKRLFAAMRSTFTVAGKQGLITQDFLDNFDPDKDLPYQLQTDVGGFDGPLLVPLMQTDSNGKSLLPTGTQTLIGKEVFADLNYGMSRGGNIEDNLYRRGYISANGTDSPYAANMLKNLFGQLSKNPEASNQVLSDDTSFAVLQKLGRGSDDVAKMWSPLFQDQLSAMVKAGTIGMADSNGDGKRNGGFDAQEGNALMRRIVLDTAANPKDHYQDFYRKTLGQLATSKAFFSDMVYSVTAVPHDGLPSNEDGWSNDARPYRNGISINQSAWAAFDTEIMQDPGTAAALTTMTSQEVNRLNQQADNTGVYVNGSEDSGAENPLATMGGYQLNAFILKDLQGASGGLQKNLENIENDKAKAKSILGTIVGIAEDPKSVVGVVGGMATDKALDYVTNLAYQSSEDDAQKKIDAVQSTLDGLAGKVSGEQITSYQDAANGYFTTVDGHRLHNTVVEVGPPGHQVRYDGSPDRYIKKFTKSLDEPPYFEDANFIDPTSHEPMAISGMSSVQLQAYEAWLHDPAIQKYAGGKAGLPAPPP